MTKPKKDDKGGKSKTPDKRLEVDDAQIRPKRNIRDSVFTDLLSFKKYALALYKAIHPEDKDVAEDDIEIVTLRRVFAYGRYNDFSMRVRGKVIIIVEAQSTWSFNVVPRLFFYLGLHWNSQFAGAANQKLYQKEPVELDDPELYVLYSGKGDFPRRLSMRELFFHGNPDKPDLVAKVISGNPNAEAKTFLDEFAFFERVYLRQLAEKIPIPKAILNTINTCVEAGALVEYLEERRAEAGVL